MCVPFLHTGYKYASLIRKLSGINGGLNLVYLRRKNNSLIGRSTLNCKKGTGILAGSWRDLGGLPPGFPPGPAEVLAVGISVPRRESRRDLGGITTGIPPRFWPPGFRFAPKALAGSPAEILAAEFSLPAVNSGGILAGLPPGSRRDFGRLDFASRREHWRDLPPRFWPPSFRSPP